MRNLKPSTKNTLTNLILLVVFVLAAYIALESVHVDVNKDYVMQVPEPPKPIPTVNPADTDAFLEKQLAFTDKDREFIKKMYKEEKAANDKINRAMVASHNVEFVSKDKAKIVTTRDKSITVTVKETKRPSAGKPKTKKEAEKTKPKEPAVVEETVAVENKETKAVEQVHKEAQAVKEAKEPKNGDTRINPETGETEVWIIGFGWNVDHTVGLADNAGVTTSYVKPSGIYITGIDDLEPEDFED